MRMDKRGEWFYEESDIDMFRVRETTSRLGRALNGKAVGPRSPGYKPPAPVVPPARRHQNDYGPHDESTAPQTVKVNAHRKTRDLIDEPMPEKAKKIRRYVNTAAHLEALARRADIG